MNSNSVVLPRKRNMKSPDLLFGLSFLFILLFTVQTVAPENPNEYRATRTQDKVETYCSRERSRTAWKIIDEYLLPFVEEEGYNMSRSCRLHPENDMFREQEQHKNHLQVNEWECGFCKKQFVSEKFLDQHFDNRHSGMLDVSRSRCLADLCGALHCDVIDNAKLSKPKCVVAAADKNRHLCESLAISCFPPKESSSARRLHDFFLRQFCDAHTCKQKKQPFPRGSGKQTSVIYYAACILLFIMLPIFYLLVCWQQRQNGKNVTDLRRISKSNKTSKSH